MTDEFDLELRDRLARMASTVPVEPSSLMGVVSNAPVRAGSTTRRLAIGGLVPILVVVLVGTLIAGLAQIVPFAVGPGGGPVSATTTDGPFEMTVRSTKARFAADEPISVEASLTYRGSSGSLDISHGHGGPFGFSIVEPVGGMKLSYGWRQSCNRSTLEQGVPIVKSFFKSGGYAGEDPAASEYAAWFADPELHLPVGTWHVFAVASFSEGAGCQGQGHEIRAEIAIEVTPATGQASAEPSPVANGLVVASTSDQGFELVIRSAKARYVPDEPIDITADLTFNGPDPSIEIWHALAARGSPIAFGIEEPVLGDLTVEPVWETACVRSELYRETPMSESFRKSGGWSSEEAGAFFLDPELRLSEGTWHVYAVAQFSIGQCSPDPVRLQVEIAIEVSADPASPEPTVTETEPPASAVTSPSPSDPVPTPGPLFEGGPSVVGIADDGTFELLIGTQTGTFHADEAIDVHVQVTYHGPAERVLLGSSDPPVTYSIEQLDGPHAIWGGAADVCTRTELFRDSAQDFLFDKSAGYDADDPDLEWIQAYLADPLVHLTPGTWRLSAYFEGAVGDCAARMHTLRADIVIEVLP